MTTLYEVYRVERDERGERTLLATVRQPTHMEAVAWAERVLHAFGPFFIRPAFDQGWRR